MARPSRSARSVAKTESYESHFEHATLFEFSKVINSSLELRFILSHILLTIMGKIVSSKGMAVLSCGKADYRVEMVKGFSPSLVGSTLTIRTIPSAAFALDKLDPRRYPWVKFFREAGAAILLPLVIADKSIGVLAFGDRFTKNKLHAREITYLRSLANISATAIEKAHTIDEVQLVNRKLDRKVQELNTLFDLGREFSAVLDPDKLIRLLEFSLLGQVGVNRYLICLKEGPDMRIAAAKVGGQQPHGEFLSLLTGIKSATFVDDIIVRGATDPREPLRAMELVVVVPMQLQGVTRGLILLGERLSKERYSVADLEFVSSLGNLAIISLENARLFMEALEKQRMEDELLIAREIQKGLLPGVIPQIPGFQIAAENVSSKQVGGDYYDVLALADGRHLIAIGDVSGKGTPAALLMANLQATIRALVPLDLPLSELTGRVNDLLCENTGGNKFVTFFWGTIDHATGILKYVNAGHNYPYIVRRGGTFDRLDKGGMILGIMKTTAPYEEEQMRFEPGDALVLFTDGVSEAMNKSQEEYGEDRLERVLRLTRSGTAREILNAIHRDVQAHTAGTAQSDDITMMVVKLEDAVGG